MRRGVPGQVPAGGEPQQDDPPGPGRPDPAHLGAHRLEEVVPRAGHPAGVAPRVAGLVAIHPVYPIQVDRLDLDGLVRLPAQLRCVEGLHVLAPADVADEAEGVEDEALAAEGGGGLAGGEGEPVVLGLGEPGRGAQDEQGGGGGAAYSGGAPRKQAAAASGKAGGNDFEDFPGALNEEDDDLPF